MTSEETSTNATGKPRLRDAYPVPDAADQVFILTRDGVRLATDVYLPTGSGPFPTIVTRMPYDKNHPENLAEAIAAAATERGYAVVAQDTRGKFRSEGELMPFRGEAADGYDTLEWTTRQAWCDSNIALWGWSYFGYTAWAALSAAHPNVRAIAPLMTSTRVGSDWVWRQGIFQLGLMATWCGVAWADKNLFEWDLEIPWHVRPLADVLPAAFAGDKSRTRVFDHMRTIGELHSWWDEASYLGDRSPAWGASVAGMHMGGWWDAFSRGQILDWTLLSHTSGLPHHLVLDALDHGLAPWTRTAEQMPAEMPAEIKYDVSAEMGLSVLEDPLALFDQVMAGRQSPLPRVKWKLTHDGFQTAEQWPPSGHRVQHLYLDGDSHKDGDGRLLWQCSTNPSWATWTHDPDDLVPGAASQLLDLTFPPDDSILETRCDVLVFTSAVFESELDLAGPIRAELQVGSSGQSMHVVVRVHDVFPDGRPRRIRDGAALVRDAPQDPHVIVDLGQTGYRIQVGHRLRVHIASSDFPRYLPYFGDERDPWTATTGVRNSQRLRLGGVHGSRLALTLLDATSR